MVLLTRRAQKAAEEAAATRAADENITTTPAMNEEVNAASVIADDTLKVRLFTIPSPYATS